VPFQRQGRKNMPDLRSQEAGGVTTKPQNRKQNKSHQMGQGGLCNVATS
jgi:hypothetical protein